MTDTYTIRQNLLKSHAQREWHALAQGWRSLEDEKSCPYRMRHYINPCEPKEATHVELNMPGPIPYRLIPVILKGTRKGTNCWSWNGDTQKPTIKPSILTQATEPLTDDEYKRVMNGEKITTREIRCHTWVNNGKVQFLNDCTHELAGQTVDTLEVE